jgi:hypothetical protein
VFIKVHWSMKNMRRLNPSRLWLIYNGVLY